MGDDARMLEIVTSANVACGFHAGDPVIMHKTVLTAEKNGIGAVAMALGLRRALEQAGHLVRGFAEAGGTRRGRRGR